MSKLIDKDAVSDYQRWELPMVEDMSAAVEGVKEDKHPSLLTAEQIERIQSQAYKEAYDEGQQKGYQEGLAAGQAEIQARAALLDKLMHALHRPFEAMDEAVERELVGLAVTLAQALVRRELRVDPGQVVAVVQEALAALPVATRNVRVCLHPDDVAVVAETIPATQPGSERDWQLQADPALSRGDCRILSDSSQIDATMERRLAALVAQLMGGDRERDASPEATKSPDGIEP